MAGGGGGGEGFDFVVYDAGGELVSYMTGEGGWLVVGAMVPYGDGLGCGELASLSEISSCIPSTSGCGVVVDGAGRGGLVPYATGEGGGGGCVCSSSKGT